MAATNSVSLTGYLGRDPELKQRSRSGAIVHLAVSTHETDGSPDGPRRTDWHRVVAQGELADTALRTLAKGARVVVTGHLRSGLWTAPDGVERKLWSVVARTITPLGRRDGVVCGLADEGLQWMDEAPSEGAQRRIRQGASRLESAPGAGGNNDDDDEEIF